MPMIRIRYYKLERKDGKSKKQAIKFLYLAAHILPHRLDWLQFGFGTMTIGKENVAKAIGAKMGVSFRGFDAFVYPLKYPGCYDKIWDKVDKVHVLSNSLKNQVNHLSDQKDLSTTIIEPAIDLQENISIKETFIHPLKILTVARLHWIKGLDYAIHAMKMLADQKLEFEYDIIGTGAEYEKLFFMIHDLELTNQVHLIGEKSHEETLKKFRDYDIYIQPSISESYCNAVLEAKAAGLLCIVSESGGLTDNIKDYTSGWLVPKMDSNSIALKIKEVMQLEHQELSRIRKNALTSLNVNSKLKQRLLWQNYFE